MMDDNVPVGLSKTTSRQCVWGALGGLAILLVVSGSLSATASDASRGGPIQCSVPSVEYPTIQSAHDDVCDHVLLASGDYPEFLTINQDFTVIGPSDFSARIVGQVNVDTSAPVRFQDVTIVTGDDPGALFSDGFESGDTAAWS